jgi:hypothetical protein
VSSTLTGRATFNLNPNALLITENDEFCDFAVPANVALQRVAQAALARRGHRIRLRAEIAGIGEELIALVGEVVEVQASGVAQFENDFRAGCLPRGSQSAEFSRFEGQRDLLRFR